MATLIAAADYKTLADYYSSARDRVLLVNDDLFDAVYSVVLLDEIMPEVDLLNSFWQTYLNASNLTETPNSILGAVRSLNAHVIVRGSYDDINEYFAANTTAIAGGPLTIDATWQSLSADVGYDISDTYVV